MKYHHLGIPTSVVRENETYIEKSKMYVSGYDTSPYRIEWMRFEPDSPVKEIIKIIPHIAFEVDNLEEALKGKEILDEPSSPGEGITVAFIIDNGAPVEFLEITNPKYKSEF
jgi:hypothetical protein